mgnify:CR=1 FL=1
MAEVVEQLVVFDQILRLAAAGNLIGKPPADDGRMVVVLHNQLGHLGEGVGAALAYAR